MIATYQYHPGSAVPNPRWRTAAIFNFIQHSITLEPFNIHLPNLAIILRLMTGTCQYHPWNAKPNPKWRTAAILNFIQHSITLEPFNIHLPNLADVFVAISGGVEQYTRNILQKQIKIISNNRSSLG
jgi:hypothetical protein